MSPAERSSAAGRGARSRRSLTDVWLERLAHPVPIAAVVLLLEAGALGGLVWWAGWRQVVHAVSVDNGGWFGLCLAGQAVAYLGYALALRAVAERRTRCAPQLPVALAIVSVGFGPMFSASSSGGFSIDYATLREAGMGKRKANAAGARAGRARVRGARPRRRGLRPRPLPGPRRLGGRRTDASWLAVVPGAVAAACLTSPRFRDRFAYRADAGATSRGFAHVIAALLVLRSLLLGWRRYGWAFGGAALYWAGDLLTFWAALRVFGVHVPLAALVVAYGTGWALTRRSLPLGGPGIVEVLMAYVLTWFGVAFAPAAAGVVAYRLFNFWLALLPAAAALRFGRRPRREAQLTGSRSGHRTGERRGGRRSRGFRSRGSRTGC